MHHLHAERCSVPEGCPGRETLSDLTLGKLPLTALEVLAAHLEGCGSCQALLEALDPLEDSFVGGLKHTPASALLNVRPELEKRIQAAGAMNGAVWQSAASKEEGIDDRLPMQLGQYELLEQIGRGGMGVVYKARHAKLKRLVAVKLLSYSRVADANAVERFQREMEAVASLDHPHVVRAYDANEVEGRHFLVMELVAGVNLARRVKEAGPLPVGDACRFVQQAALGLQHAHEHGLVHRDLKPSNLMLAAGGQVKILDLGLSRLRLDNDGPGEQEDGGFMLGTADFMAPEQATDPRQADIRADIYSLGCTLYYLLTARPPFPEGTLIQKLAAHREKEPRPLTEFRTDLPEGLEKVVGRMTAKNPDRRFQTPAEVVRALAPFADKSPAYRRGSRRRLVWAVLGMLAVAVLGAGVVRWYRVTASGDAAIPLQPDPKASQEEPQRRFVQPDPGESQEEPQRRLRRDNRRLIQAGRTGAQSRLGCRGEASVAGTDTAASRSSRPKPTASS